MFSPSCKKALLKAIKKIIGDFMCIFRFIFVFLFPLFFLATPTLALDIKVILPKNVKVLPAKVDKMLKHLKTIIPAEVAKVLSHQLILDFSKKSGNLNIQCPSQLIKEYSSAMSEKDSYALISEWEYLANQYVEVPALFFQWSSHPLQFIQVHEGFLKDDIKVFPSCYQSANYFSKIDYLEGQLLRSIGKIWNRNAKMHSQFLASQQRVRQFSDSSLFSHLDNWGSGSVFFANKNVWEGDELKLVAPAIRISAFQTFSLEDSFSIYFEKFLNDKDFACKKPATHMYFKNIMNFSPFGIKECANLNTKIYDGFLNKNIFNLDPSRIKEIHILLAGPGKALMSRWGHTMFRVVVCAEGDSGEDCVSNSFDDIVLGFGAYVSGMQIDPIKGVFGKYPSLIFPATMSNIKNEYNRTGLRDLTSIPVNFTKEEVKFFVYRALQNFWSYRGKYYYLTNNCATESNDFLMGSFLANPEKSYLLHELLGSNLTPTGSISDIKNAKSKPEYKALKNTFNLSNLNRKKNNKTTKFYTSPSYRPTLQKLVNLLKPLDLPKEEKPVQSISAERSFSKMLAKEKVDIKFLPKLSQGNQVEMFKDLPIEERVSLYEKLLKNKPKYANALTLLEGYIRRSLEKSIKSSAVSLAINVKNPSPEAQKVLEAFKKVTKSHIQVHSFNSYGIPSSAEVSLFLKKLTANYAIQKSEMIDPSFYIDYGDLGDWNWEDELVERSHELSKKVFPEWVSELKKVKNLLQSLEEYSETKTLSF